MKKSILLLFLLATVSGSAQNISHYKKVYDYNEYHKDWALVKSITGTYGFIDRNGKEIVPAIYDKIYKFNDIKLAMVKSVAGTYGFIDDNGKEVVPAIYDKIYEFNDKKLAMVKNVAGAYGFINDNGKEVVKAIYFKKEEAIQRLNIPL